MENDMLKEIIAIDNASKVSSVKVNLSTLENPFNWNIGFDDLTSEEAVRKFDIGSIKFANESFSLRMLTSKLSLAYELYKIGEKYASLNCMLELKFKLRYDDEHEDEHLFCVIEDALKHVLFSSIAYVYFNMGQIVDANKILSTIVTVDNMNESNRAALYGIRAGILMKYGHKGNEQSREFIEKAIAIDPTNVHWYIMKVFTLFRIRWMKYPPELPSDEEMELLEDCRRKTTSLCCLLTVADIYRATCSSLIHSSQPMTDSIEAEVKKFAKLAYDLYIKCSDDKSANSGVLISCAQGLFKLPEPYNYIHIGRELLVRGFDKNPRSVHGNKLKAYCFEKFDRNYKSAKHHLQHCVDHGDLYSALDIARIDFKIMKHHKTGMRYLDECENTFPKFHRIIILSHKVSTLIFLTSDMPLIFDHLNKIMEIDPYCKFVMHHYSFLHIMKHKASLYSLVISKINSLLEDTACLDETKQLCLDFLQKLSTYNIPMSDIPKNFHVTILHDSNIVNKIKTSKFIGDNNEDNETAVSSVTRSFSSRSDFSYVRGRRSNVDSNWRSLQFRDPQRFPTDNNNNNNNNYNTNVVERGISNWRSSRSANLCIRRDIFGYNRPAINQHLYTNTIFTDAGNRHERIILQDQVSVAEEGGVNRERKSKKEDDATTTVDNDTDDDGGDDDNGGGNNNDNQIRALECYVWYRLHCKSKK